MQFDSEFNQGTFSRKYILDVPKKWNQNLAET